MAVKVSGTELEVRDNSSLVTRLYPGVRLRGGGPSCFVDLYLNQVQISTRQIPTHLVSHGIVDPPFLQS